MKNPLLLIVFFFIGATSYLQAQDCAISTAEISADSNCIFVTWDPGLSSLEKPIAILVNGTQFLRVDSIGSTYSLTVNDTTYTCDTTDRSDFVGEITIGLFGENLTCEFKNGESLPACPEDVLISQSENCLIFTLQDGYAAVPPDSVRLNDSVYYNQGYTPGDTSLVFIINDSLACDTFNMNNMLLNDTLNIDGQICTYQEGLLPITILAFDYRSEDNGVALSWEVNSDEPTRKLFLQKSYDGVDWMNLYEQNLNNYAIGQTMDGQYMDRTIEQPKLYYRLLIAGYSGAEKYSSILPVTRKDQVINNLFYQSGSRSIMIKAGQNFTGEMHLINAQGQNMMTRKVKVLKNSFQEVQLEGHLTPGIYFVKFDNGLVPPTKIFIDN